MDLSGIPIVNGFRKPENPVTGMLKRTQKYNIVLTADIGDEGRTLTISKQRKEDNLIYNTLRKRKTVVAHKSIDFELQDDLRRGAYRIYMTDESCGTTVELIPGGTTCLYKPNSGVIADMIDSSLVPKTWRLKVDYGVVIASLIIGAVIGALFLAPFLGAFFHI